MTWTGHDHRGEYAAAQHSHDRYDVHGVAEEHHRHYDTESALSGLREDLGRAQERIRELEDRQAALLRVLQAGTERYEAIRAAGMADEAYLAVHTELAELLISLASALAGEEPEPEEYDPGPEVDDEGGMPEYRSAALPAGEW